MILILMAGFACADGIGMTEDHHFTYKPETCYTLKLTGKQMEVLESKREGGKKLYADLELTKGQSALLKEKTGKAITKVLVFENGWNDCSCCANNIASRFKPDQIEVSDEYLVDEGDLRKWAEERKKAEEASSEKSEEK